MKEIELHNFRCFETQRISFRGGINLLVGDNASGKTSILKACRYVLSSFFSGFSDENTSWKNPDVDDFREVVTSDGIVLPEQPIRLFFNTEDTMDLSLLGSRQKHMELGGLDFPFVLAKNSKKNSRSLITGISEYKRYASLLQQSYFADSEQTRTLPLFASFSTEDIHSKRKIDAARFKSYYAKPSLGYYECLEGDGFFSYWIKRLLVLQEGREGHPEISIVRHALQKALGIDGCAIIKDMQVRPIQKKVYFIFLDGREIEADYLSDGYRRLVNIVIDVAFRCALLNRGIYGEETCSLTKGTVLIDEVDLHLHPTLQSLVLKGLKHAFSSLQFIVSTHAPMVMSGVETNEENVVYKLVYTSEQSYSVTEINTYGMDLSTLTDVVLDQMPRAKEVGESLHKLFDLIDNDEIKEARSLLSELRAMHRDNLPELSEAEAMLDCVIDSTNENDF
ncbi:MAG: AAA family ATPase [Phocaeicola sp.]